MNKLKALLAFTALLFTSNSMAELLPVLTLSPGSPQFSTSREFNPAYPAWTYPAGDADGHDVWTFDLTAFDSNFPVSTDLTLGDYCCHQDDYNIYWDNVLLGNTGLAVQRLFEFDTTAAIHMLEIEWLNPIPGGSWYNIDIRVAGGPPVGSVVPVPAAAWLFGTALIGLLGIGKRRQTA